MQQIVDPFMPTTMQLPRNLRPKIPVQRIVHRANQAPLPRRTIDGMISRPVQRTFVSTSEFRRPAQQTAKPVVATSMISEVNPAAAPAVAPTADQSVFENQFVPQPQPQAIDRPQSTVQAQPKIAAKSRTKRMLAALQVPGIILASVVIGYFMQSLVYGEIAIAVYAIVALLFKVASRTTFMLALMSLFVIIITVIANPGSTLSTNFAVYTFLLLVVGTVSLGREVRSETAH
ncbi:MAG TPA: hypothetical protein VLG47_07700 [Candidatus Saccharimonadales bacterium]|nr:hypothetical protein [Candidatus Saccharimonadales bacterium]